MSRIVIVNVSDRPRPRLSTPRKGEVGDLCDESMERLTNIDLILKRYGGNLAEMVAWRGRLEFGEQPPCDLEDALDAIRNAHDALHDIPNNPFRDLDDAFAAISDGSFGQRVEDANKPVNPPSENPTPSDNPPKGE